MATPTEDLEANAVLMRGEENGDAKDSNGSSKKRPNMDNRLSVRAQMYDLDGDGKLDSMEMQLRAMDDGDGLNKFAVQARLQELIATQKALYSTKRILMFVSIFAILMLVSIFGLSFAVARLTDDTDTKGQELITTAPIEETGETEVVATVADGHVIHIKDLKTDPYGIAVESGSLFFPEGSATGALDLFDCSFRDYLEGAKIIGEVDHCGSVHHAAEFAQKMSFLNQDEANLLPGQSLINLVIDVEESWYDPIRETVTGESLAGFSFFAHTMHMIKGTIGASGECRVLMFLEDVTMGKKCQVYERSDCSIPTCITDPPTLERVEQPQGNFPQP